MRKTKLKLCSLFMSIVMLLSLLPVTALAADVSVGNLTDLQSEIDGATGTTTITLTDDIAAGTLTNPSTDTGIITIPAGKNITIDLAGHKISGSLVTDGGSYARAHIILNNGTLTITDSSENHTGEIVNTNTGSNDCTRTVENNGTLTITGGTISGTVALLNLGSCLIDGENVVIKSEASFGGGGWDNSAAAIEHRDAKPVAANAGLTIKSGAVSSASRAAVFCDASTKFYIQGGTFTGNEAYGAVNGSTADNMAVVTGGLFSSDPTSLIDQSAYLAADTSNGYYEVVKIGTSSEVTVSTEAELLSGLRAPSQDTPR